MPKPCQVLSQCMSSAKAYLFNNAWVCNDSSIHHFDCCSKLFVNGGLICLTVPQWQTNPQKMNFTVTTDHHFKQNLPNGPNLIFLPLLFFLLYIFSFIKVRILRKFRPFPQSEFTTFVLDGGFRLSLTACTWK